MDATTARRAVRKSWASRGFSRRWTSHAIINIRCCRAIKAPEHPQFLRKRSGASAIICRARGSRGSLTVTLGMLVGGKTVERAPTGLGRCRYSGVLCEIPGCQASMAQLLGSVGNDRTDNGWLAGQRDRSWDGKAPPRCQAIIAHFQNIASLGNAISHQSQILPERLRSNYFRATCAC
jgi:hypothetical protein